MDKETFARGIADAELHEVLYGKKYRPLSWGCRQRGHHMTLEQHDRDGSSLPLDTHLMLFTMRGQER